MIGADHRQAAEQHVEPAGFGRVVAVVLEIGLVHHPPDRPQHRVTQVVALKQRLERAVPAVMGELDAPHVKRRRVVRNLVGIPDEHELGLGVDEPADQPRTRRAIDVRAGARRPPHAATRSTPAASSRTAASAGSRARD